MESPESKTTPPHLVQAKKVLDEIMAIQPTIEVGQFPPTDQEQYIISQKIYYQRMTVIYLALTNAAMEARSEQHGI